MSALRVTLHDDRLGVLGDYLIEEIPQTPPRSRRWAVTNASPDAWVPACFTLAPGTGDPANPHQLAAAVLHTIGDRR